jgi:hypothetical protein
MLAKMGYVFNLEDLSFFDVQVYSTIENELNKLEQEEYKRVKR